MDAISTDVQQTVYKSNRLRFLTLPVMGLLLLALPLLLIFLSDADHRGAGVAILLVTGPPGVLMLLIGASYLRLRMELGAEALEVSLPYAKSEPWFPWLVHQATIPWSELQQIDVKLRANPYAPEGVERLVLLRSTAGDYYFNSIWFHKFDELLARVANRSGVTLTEENLDQPPVATPGEPPPQLSFSERLTRGFGWTVLGALVVLTIVAGAVAITGNGEAATNALFGMLMMWLAYPAVQMLLRYRRPR